MTALHVKDAASFTLAPIHPEIRFTEPRLHLNRNKARLHVHQPSERTDINETFISIGTG